MSDRVLITSPRNLAINRDIFSRDLYVGDRDLFIIPYADYFFYDNFTDANGILLQNHIPEKGSGYIKDSGNDIVIQANGALQDSTTKGNYFLIGLDNLDFTVTISGDQNGPDGVWSHFEFRRADGENLIYWDIATYTGGCYWVFLEAVGGVAVQGAEGASCFEGSGIIDTRVVLNGSHGEFYQNGNLIYSTDTLSPLLLGNNVMWFFIGKGNSMDNLTIQAL